MLFNGLMRINMCSSRIEKRAQDGKETISGILASFFVRLDVF